MRVILINIIVAIGLFSPLASFAQPGEDGPPQDRKEYIRTQKIAFISTELALTTDEAEKFWPVYNEYDAKIETLRKERKGYAKELKTINDLTEDRAYELTELIFDTEKREVELRGEYLVKFAEVLDKKKAAKVFVAEEKFKRELMEMIKDHDKPPHDGQKKND